jgi:hypothetical protein
MCDETSTGLGDCLDANATTMRVRGATNRRALAKTAIALLLTIGVGGAAGCGQAAAPSRTVAKTAKVALATRSSPRSSSRSTPRSSPARARPHARPRAQPHGVVARIDAASDAVLAEGKVHIAAGAPSDAEIRREIKAARKAGIKLPSGESVASFENAPSNSGGGGVEASTPVTAWNPRSKPIADWIIPILEWASLHGWTGTVTSGYRTYYEQAQLNAAGAFSALAGRSNHETTVYPGGAVDVTNSSQLIAVLRSYAGPVKLVGGVLGPVDPEHFSATGD